MQKRISELRNYNVAAALQIHGQNHIKLFWIRDCKPKCLRGQGDATHEWWGPGVRQQGWQDWGDRRTPPPTKGINFNLEKPSAKQNTSVACSSFHIMICIILCIFQHTHIFSLLFLILSQLPISDSQNTIKSNSILIKLMFHFKVIPFLVLIKKTYDQALFKRFKIYFMCKKQQSPPRMCMIDNTGIYGDPDQSRLFFFLHFIFFISFHTFAA